MKFILQFAIYFLCISLWTSCSQKNTSSPVQPTVITTGTETVEANKDTTPNDLKEEETVSPHTSNEKIQVAAERTHAYFPLLEQKNIALVVNHTSYIDDTHLVDSLLNANFKIQKIFAPEHGFRGKADAGASVANGKDSQTGLPIVSLYGKNKKPTAQQLAGIDLVIFDIQDVGARFYTYISTMHYVMEACAEQNIPFLVLDRPNPNGHYVDGYVLDTKYRSFVGMHPIPVVHGLTVAELALMINGEGWLKDGIKCNLTFVECGHYNHNKTYSLPIPPSPNLPNDRSIYLYPSLCFFEGTTANIGRGTTTQFQVIGHPKYPNKAFQYKPVSRVGAKHPKFQNKTCYGINLSENTPENIYKEGQLNLSYLVDFYSKMKSPSFILKNKFMDKLAGTNRLRKALLAGQSETEIRASWQEELNAYKKMREKYLLYKN